MIFATTKEEKQQAKDFIHDVLGKYGAEQVDIDRGKNEFVLTLRKELTGKSELNVKFENDLISLIDKSLGIEYSFIEKPLIYNSRRSVQLETNPCELTVRTIN